MLPREFTLETPRCRLRHVTLEDIPHVFSATRFPGFNDGMLWEPPEREEELLAPHENSVRSWEEGLAYSFTIECKTTGAFIGRISARREKGEVWSMGFWTHPDQQGRGYVTEAALAVRDVVFSELGADRLVACHAIWNVASERVLLKLGMRLVRHMPQGFQKRGEWVAENLLGLSRAEWLAREASERGADPEPGAVGDG